MKTLKIMVPLLLILAAGCTNYGKKVTRDENEVYYKSPVTEQEANQLADYLVDLGYFNDKPKSVQLLRDSANNLVLNMIIAEDYREDESTKRTLVGIGAEICRDVFECNNITVNICDQRFNTVSSLPMHRITMGQGDLFYTNDIKPDEAQAVKDHLFKLGAFTPKDDVTLYLEKQGDTYLFEMTSLEGAETNPEVLQKAQILMRELSNNVLDGKPVDFYFLDVSMQIKGILHYSDITVNDTIPSE